MGKATTPKDVTGSNLELSQSATPHLAI